ALHQNLYGPGFVYSVDRGFVASCQTPCLLLAGNDEAHPLPISEEVAKLLPKCELIREWKQGQTLADAKPRIKEFLTKHAPARGGGGRGTRDERETGDDLARRHEPARAPDLDAREAYAGVLRARAREDLPPGVAADRPRLARARARQLLRARAAGAQD